MTFHRTSKACELCRERKTRCFPGPTGATCGPCTSLGAECKYRAKPRIRSKRARTSETPNEQTPLDDQVGNASSSKTNPFQVNPSSRARTPPSGQLAFPFDGFGITGQWDLPGKDPSNISPIELTGTGPSICHPPQPGTPPLKHVEDLLREWSRQHNIPESYLLFDIGSRLSTLQGAPPLPAAEQRQFEDALIRRLVTSPDFGHLNIVDHWSLSSLYGRYAALPETVNEDQRAFIMASLCIIRYSEIRLGQNSPAVRHDITFYNTATAYLQSWSRPSRWSFAALFCLVPYTFSMGGPSETRALLEQMAWHARGLGLTRRSTAKLYAPLGMIGPFFAVYMYSDIFNASLTDVVTCVDLAEVEVDVTPPSTLTAECLIVASRHTATYLSDRADPALDTTTAAYIERRESEWCAELSSLRQAQNAKIGRDQNQIAWVDSQTQLAWAELRYNWLRLLLHIPLLHLVTSVSAVARSLTQTLYTYTDLARSGNLEPSWPQAQRLLVCGQLLILCQDRGEVQRSESVDLWVKLLDLLAKHKEQLPICGDMCNGFRKAIEVYGILGPVDERLQKGAASRASELYTTLTDLAASQAQADQSILQDVSGSALNMEQYGGVGRLDQLDVLPFDEFSSEFFSTLFGAMNDGREGSGPFADFE